MKRKSIAAVLWPALALASSLPAQTAQTALFRAVMPSSMSSASRDSGAADVVLHVVKDASGNILSGSVDFNLAYQFPNDESVTGLGIADTGGGTTFLVATNITAASPVLATAGNGRIFRQVQVMPGNQVGLSVLSLLFANPSQYSIGVVTADQPAGAMSGPLQAGSSAFLMALLNSSAGTGVATVIVSYTGAASAITSGEVTMQLTYQFPAQVTFSDMRVYAGQGENGQIAVAADLMPGPPSAASGAGVLTAPATEIDMTDSQMVQSVQNMLAVPANFSVDVDTVENASAPLTGQLRGTDFMTFAIPGFAGAGAASEIGLHTLRDASGSVLAGTVAFDVNYRLAAGAQITGIDIDGNVTAPAVSTDPSGSGNAYTLIGVYGGAGLTSLNGVVADPSAHQLDVLTTSTMSAPLAAANAAAPVHQRQWDQRSCFAERGRCGPSAVQLRVQERGLLAGELVERGARRRRAGVLHNRHGADHASAHHGPDRSFGTALLRDSEGYRNYRRRERQRHLLDRGSAVCGGSLSDGRNGALRVGAG